MDYISLIIIVVFISLQSICAKEYDKKTKNGALLFSSLTVFFATIVFVISFLLTTDGGFRFSKTTLYYALLFALSYGSATVGSIYAIKYGSLSLTSLLTSFSLLIPTFYGILVLDDETGPFLYIGLFLLLVSLVLVNLEDKSQKSNQKITLKWILFVIMSFAGNGICTITQKMQQINQSYKYKNEFMIVALLMVGFGTLILSLILEKKPAQSLRQGIIPGGIRGIANGIVNLLVISLAHMPASVMFPVISGGGIALTSILAMTLYREKLSTNQILGLIFGITSVVLLNI